MTDSDEYQGWSNRETWALNLHLSNDHGLYDMVNEWAGEARRDASKLAEIAKDRLETLLDPGQYRDEFGGEQPDGLAMMAREVGSLWRVDWHEFAEAWLED